MIQFRSLALTRGARVLFEQASLQLHPGWRVGVIGANGSGKSSLFALLRGELPAEQGSCELPAAWRIASVAQETPPLASSAIDYVLDGDVELRARARELATAEERPGSAPRMDGGLAQVAEPRGAGQGLGEDLLICGGQVGEVGDDRPVE